MTRSTSEVLLWRAGHCSSECDLDSNNAVHFQLPNHYLRNACHSMRPEANPILTPPSDPLPFSSPMQQPWQCERSSENITKTKHSRSDHNITPCVVLQSRAGPTLVVLAGWAAQRVGPVGSIGLSAAAAGPVVGVSVQSQPGSRARRSRSVPPAPMGHVSLVLPPRVGVRDLVDGDGVDWDRVHGSLDVGLLVVHLGKTLVIAGLLRRCFDFEVR